MYQFGCKLIVLVRRKCIGYAQTVTIFFCNLNASISSIWIPLVHTYIIFNFTSDFLSLLQQRKRK